MILLRRLVVELFGPELEKRIADSAFGGLESMEIIHLLHSDRNEFAGIWRLRARDRNTDIESTFRRDGGTKEIHLLEREKNGGVIVFMRRLSRSGSLFSHENIMHGGGYLFGPMEIQNGRMKTTFIGNQRYVRKVLTEIERRGINYKVVLLADADFAPESLLYRLTEKQRKVLLAAYKQGYYNVPRKTGSEQLAMSLNLTRATVVEHLRKAEYRLLTEIVLN